MGKLYSNQFLVDVRESIVKSKELRRLQFEYSFSEMCFHLLKEINNSDISGYFKGLHFLDFKRELLCENIRDLNEDSIFSFYIFFFARKEGLLIGEIITGKSKGNIVSINEEYFSDVDSIEELLEDYNISLDKFLRSESDLLDLGIEEIRIEAKSIIEFILK